jgi:hypothetical protein
LLVPGTARRGAALATGARCSNDRRVLATTALFVVSTVVCLAVAESISRVAVRSEETRRHALAPEVESLPRFSLRAFAASGVEPTGIIDAPLTKTGRDS